MQRSAPAGVSVIVPTYRESANVEPLAERVAAVLAGTGEPWELLLVDDDSRDGTGEVVQALCRRFPLRLHVRRGVPRDLSAAVLDGFALARHNRLVVMDADLSHPPERIPDLLAGLADADIVVGSRYAPGGRLDDAWTVRRRLASRLATLLARPLGAGSDPMSGFFAIGRESLPERGTLHPLGFKIGLELIVRGGLRFRDVAIDFRDRERGTSKMDWRAQTAYLRHLHRLYLARFRSPARLGTFLAVGASGFVVDVGCYLALQWLGVEHRLARLLSFWPAVTWNWRINRALTFADRPPMPATRQWARFAVSSAVGLALNVGGYALLTSYVAFFAEHRLLALLAGVALGSAANFLAATGWVFRRPRQRSSPREA